MSGIDPGHIHPGRNQRFDKIDIASQEKPVKPSPEPPPAEKASDGQQNPGREEPEPDSENASADEPERHPDEMKG